MNIFLESLMRNRSGKKFNNYAYLNKTYYFAMTKKVLFTFLTILLIACQTQNPQVRINTNQGDMQIELYPQKAPITVKNFLSYVDAGKYSGAEFYRVVTLKNQPDKNIKIEVIQGGLEFRMNIDTIPGIEHETTDKTGIRHKDGTISMARNTPGSASSEFFICIGSQPELDYGGKRNPDGQGFAAFGKVLTGMEVVRRIQKMSADSNQILFEKVKILSVERE